MESWIEETLHPGFRLRLKADRILFDNQTDHQHLVIFENAQFGRVMNLDGVTQLTTADEFIYHEMITHLPLFAHGRASSVLIVGGGDGGTLRECLKHKALEHVTLCEIDEGVIDLSRKYFPDVSQGAFDDPRSEIVIADGTEFVAGTDQRFDVIVVDSTDPIGPGAVLFTKEFYADCARCLTEGGILVTQNGVPFLQGPELAASLSHFAALFGDAWAYLASTPTYVGGPMAYGWATNNLALRRLSRGVIGRRFSEAAIETRYYNPDVHAAAFALPNYVRTLIET